jgi:hypothetical protein
MTIPTITDKLIYISNKTKKLPKFYHIGIKDILKYHNVTLNKSGEKIAINLTVVNPEVIEEVLNYVKYAEEQEFRLQTNETKMDAIKNEHFSEN